MNAAIQKIITVVQKPGGLKEANVLDRAFDPLPHSQPVPGSHFSSLHARLAVSGAVRAATFMAPAALPAGRASTSMVRALPQVSPSLPLRSQHAAWFGTVSAARGRSGADKVPLPSASAAPPDALFSTSAARLRGFMRAPFITCSAPGGLRGW